MAGLLIIVSLLVGTLLGIGLGGWWLRRQTRRTADSATEIVDSLIAALGPESYGIAVIDDAGGLVESNAALASILRHDITDDASEEDPVPLGEWAKTVDPADRRAIPAWVTDPAARNQPLSVRLNDAADTRWLRLLFIRSSPLGSTILLLDESQAVLLARRERIALRNARLTVQVADALAVAESTENAFVDVLSILREQLDLRSGSWFAVNPDSGELTEFASDLDSPESPAPLPEDVVRAMQDPYGRLAGGLPLTIDGPDPRLLLPVLTNGHLSDILVLHANRPDTWDAETAEQLMIVTDKIGRRTEQFIGDEEREAWASTRGSLERAEAIAQLTGSIAHDFNGILFAIQGRLELLRSELGDGQIQSDVDEIENAIVEAKRLAERLRSALRGDQEPVPINVASEIDTIVESARRLLPTSLEIDHHIQPEVRNEEIVLYAPANALEQILMHLIVNARDALGVHGRIMVGVRLAGEDRLEIRIDDDGPGIPSPDRNRLMEPYETGDSSVGTGLGLPICKRLVIQRQGDFQLLDSPLGGLAVSMAFPIRRPNQSTASAPVSTTHRTARRVLVVEDNTIIRDVLVRVFEGSGARVDARGDASEVEEILQNHPETDLLVFDIDLPGRTGIECLEALRAGGVDIPCLFITGGITEPPVLERIAFLRKPFRIDVLRRTASQLLDQRI